ncbi:hypothetical protein ACJMK2_041627 [Sinanodonta woodiana]|uniref:THAP-type domain-containing protein n=1 Tax=Sinanodonta woodiana TaxID=1069815 RepID=A0ABD3W652_SINWO
MYMPIKMYPFPREMKDPEMRNKWISYISRTSPASKRPMGFTGMTKNKNRKNKKKSAVNWNISKFQSGLDFDNTEKISMCQNHASPSDIHREEEVQYQVSYLF